MIVTFKTKAHSDIIYLGDVALELLRLMGRRETIPSAMYADDIPEALAKLKAAVESDDAHQVDSDSDSSENDAEPPVSLKHRALPLIQLLEAAQEAATAVMWE